MSRNELQPQRIPPSPLSSPSLHRPIIGSHLGTTTTTKQFHPNAETGLMASVSNIGTAMSSETIGKTDFNGTHNDATTTGMSTGNTVKYDTSEQQQQYDIDNDDDETLRDKHRHHNRHRPSCFIIHVTIMASLGGILFGYDLGIISCALPELTSSFDLLPKQQELVVSILYVGGVFGATIGGSICDLFGRKMSILLCDVIFGLGAIIFYKAQNITSILVGRVVVGFAIALSGIADVTYLHEIAPIEFRGAIVSVNEACIALGFLLAFAIGSIPALSYKASVEGDAVPDEHTGIEGWRVMFGVSGIVALLQFIGMLYLPESPKWLNDRGRHEESVIAQHQIQSDPVLYHVPSPSASVSTTDHHRKNSRTMLMMVPDAHRDTANRSPENLPISSNYQSIASPISAQCTTDSEYEEATIMSTPTRRCGLLSRLCCSPLYQIIFLCQQFCTFIRTMMSTQYRRQTYITLFLATTQQFCGQTNVLSYAPLILAAASANSANSRDASLEAYATVSIGIMKFIVTIFVIWKIESIGRRTFLLWGIATIAVGLFLLAVAFAGTKVVQEQNVNNDGGEQAQTEEKVSHVENTYSGFFLAVPGVLLVVCGYSMSYGPLTWLITSELYPTEIRGRALGVSTIVTYACAAIVTFTFLSASALVGSSILFSCYLSITCIGFLFAYLAVPDTGGRNPDGIDLDLDRMIWWQGRQQRSAFNKNPTKSWRTTTSPTENKESDFVAETEIT
jgi:MFS family permease